MGFDNEHLTDIPQARIIHIIERMMRFPYPTICRHSVAADLLSLLEEYGRPVSTELARAIVQADDDTALVLLARERESTQGRIYD